MPRITDDHFNKVSKVYGDYAHLAGGRQKFAEIDKRFVEKCDGPIVDIGSGSGAFLEYFDFSKSTSLVAVDSNEKMLRKNKNKSIVKVVCDVAAIPLLADSAGAVLARQIFQYLSIKDELKNALDEARRILRRDGWLITHHMTTPDWDHVDGFSDFMSVDGLQCRFPNASDHLADIRAAGFDIHDSKSATHRREESEEHFCWIRNIAVAALQDRCSALDDRFNLCHESQTSLVRYDAQYTFVIATKS